MTIENVAFGVSINDIVLPSGETHMGILGGGGPQTAWGMAAVLGSGETVGLAARVGPNLPDNFFAPLEKAGINLEGVQHTSLYTPQAWEVMEHDGTRTHLWRVPDDILAKQMIRGWDILPTHYQGAKNFHWGLDAEKSNHDISNAHRLKIKGNQVSLEPYRLPDHPLKHEQLQKLVQSCNIISLSWQEACRITEYDEYVRIITEFRDAGTEILLVRRDKQGADIYNFTKSIGVHVPAIKTHVVDVIGAGNTFSGGFLVQLQNSIEEAACHASVVASYMIEQIGLPQRLPDPADYKRRFQEAKSGLEYIKI